MNGQVLLIISWLYLSPLINALRTKRIYLFNVRNVLLFKFTQTLCTKLLATCRLINAKCYTQVKSFQSFPRIFKHNGHAVHMAFGPEQEKKRLHLHMGIILIPWHWDVDHFWVRCVQSAAGLSVQLSAGHLFYIQAWWRLDYFMK